MTDSNVERVLDEDEIDAALVGFTPLERVVLPEPREQVCMRVADVGYPSTHWGPFDRCSRCGYLVVESGGPHVRLVCGPCFRADYPEIQVGLPADWHPPNDRMHCSECYFQLRYWA